MSRRRSQRISNKVQEVQEAQEDQEVQEVQKKKKEVKKEIQEKKEVLENQDESEVLYELDEKEMIQANKVFDLNCPSNGKEMLNNDQLKTAMRAMGYEPRADEIKSLLKKYANRAGKINRDGFHKIMAYKIGSTPGSSDNNSKDQISRVFDLLDLDKTGNITLENLRSISKELNEDITDEELTEMIREADKDGDCQINKAEFHDIMKKTSLY